MYELVHGSLDSQSEIGTYTKLTGGWPILDVTGAVHHRVVLAVSRGRAQRVPLLHTVQTVGRCHVARGLQVADFHPAYESPSRAHAQPH